MLLGSGMYYAVVPKRHLFCGLLLSSLAVQMGMVTTMISL
ncbi:hypothetical protein FKM95_000112 [Candidatus Tremblaya phenacola]|nr:hypothetical protein FKM95_000112 [Candidatus Tremblaya phenacola]